MPISLDLGMAWSTYLVAVLTVLAFIAVFILLLRTMVNTDTIIGSTVNNVITQLNNTYGPLPSDPLHLNTSSWVKALNPLTLLLNNYVSLILIFAIVLALAFSRRR